MRRILLLHNTPKARRYFQALAAHIHNLDIRVRGIGLRGGPALAPGEAARIAGYTMARKHARGRIPNWRLRRLQAVHERVARWHYHSARVQILAQRPEAIGVWGGQSVDARAALRAAAALGVPAYTFECGLLPRTTTCDPRGVNADNALPRSPGFYARYDAPAELPRTLLPRAARRPQAAVTLPRRYVFVPLQVRLDSQVLLYSPWIRDMRHLFAVLTEARREAGLEDVALVFKRHPSCRADYADLEGLAAAMPGVLFANGNPTQALIDNALGVATINSTVGIEALLLERPVLTLGRACYAIDGVAASAHSVGEVAAWLRGLAQGTLPAARHRQAFLHYLANEYCIPGHHKSPGPAHYAALAQRLDSHPADRGQSLWAQPPGAVHGLAAI